MLSDPFELADLLDIEIGPVSPDRAVATLEVSDKHHQPHGFMHGGMSLLLAETVAGAGADEASPLDVDVFGMEINANHLRPVKSGTVTALATPVHQGRSTQVWTIEITDEEDRTVCVSRCTLSMVSS